VSTAWQGRMRGPLSWQDYLAIAPEVRRELEIVDGHLMQRELRDDAHRAVVTRLLGVLGEAAAATPESGPQAEHFGIDTEVDVLLWRVPPTARKPDAVLYHVRPGAGVLTAEDVVIAAEVLTPWSRRRDRAHKMADYADAGIPHYWLVEFDAAGAVGIERYTLDPESGGYRRTETSRRG
jgi:Uma2 family endonuclease